METTVTLKKTALNEAALTIHHALHDSNTTTVTINGTTFEIQVYHNGCRFVDYPRPYVKENGTPSGAIRFMEQNKKKASGYAELARSGNEITWGIRPNSYNWMYVLNGEVKRGLIAKKWNT